MQEPNKFIKHYEEGFMPWDHSKADFNLVEMVDNCPIKAGKSLDIGCGTGTESIFLCQNGFDATAIDLSPIAIAMAKEKAASMSCEVDFKEFDFLNEDLPNEEFDFAFDRGFFHGFDTDKDRKHAAARIANTLKKDGLWLSLIGNADGTKTDPGPPLRSATEIVSSVEESFKLIAIRASHFGNDQANPARIWVCLMRKRD